MDNKDDKKRIHVNPEFIAKRVAQVQTNTRVHVNPAFFQKSRTSHDFASQPINSTSRSLGLQEIKSISNTPQCPPSTLVLPKVKSNTAISAHESSLSKHISGGNCTMSHHDWKQSQGNMSAVSRFSMCEPVYSFAKSYHDDKLFPSDSSKTHANDRKLYSWNAAKLQPSKYVQVDSTHSDQRSKFKVDNRAGSQTKKMEGNMGSSFYENDSYKRRTGNLIGEKFTSASVVTSVRKPVGEVQGVRKVRDLEMPYQNHAKVQNSSSNVYTNIENHSLSFGTKTQNPSSFVCSKTPITSLNACTKTHACTKTQNTSSFSMHVNSSDSLKQYKRFPNDSTTLASHVPSASEIGKPSEVVTTAGSTFVATRLLTGCISTPEKCQAPKNDGCVFSKNVMKSSNVLVNPVLLKSLSKGETNSLLATCKSSQYTDSLLAACKSSPYNLNNNMLVESKVVKVTNDNTYKKVEDYVSKYKMISKTKLVRRRSRSFSKGCHTEKKLITYPIRKEQPSPLALCRPSSVFPTRYHNSFVRNHPKRRYAVISRTKLIRRLSGSSSTGLNVQEKQKYSVKTKTKLVKKSSGGSQKLKTVDRSKLCIINPVVESKHYTVLSKTKLIRRRSSSGTIKTKGLREVNKSNIGSIVKRHKLVRNAQVKQGKIYPFRSLDNKTVQRINTKYKIENRGTGMSAKQKMAKGIISKYRINRLKGDTHDMKRGHNKRFSWVSNKRKDQNRQQEIRRTSGKFSDRFVNIGGILYKATRTSLRKQMAKENYVQGNGRGSKCIIKLRGNQYRVSAGGRALTRVMKQPVSSSEPLLSRVHIGGLTYSRTKTGHYELTKVHQARAVLSYAKQRSMMMLSQKRKRGALQKCNQYCIFFNRFGRCSKKDKGECRYLHDPKRIAICTRFLRGRCPVSNCPFSHEIDPDKMPVCSHFAKSICTRDDCPYRHVRVNPNAPLCLDFLQGYCLRGEECKKQHVLECNEFTSSGKCPRGKACPLSHRKQSQRKRKSLSKEPAKIASNKRFYNQPSRRRKSSDTFDVLGGPGVVRRKPKVQKTRLKDGVQRYFQVSADSRFNKSNCEDISRKEGISHGKSDVIVINKNDSNETNLGDNSKSINHETDVLDVEQKRERVLQQVEKMKQAYSAQGETHSKMEDAYMGIGDVNKEGNEDVNKEAKCNSPEFKCDTSLRRPLPKRLPSYISLSRESGDVEDL